MRIAELSPDECRQQFAQAEFGRLACAHDGQPYVIPIYFAFDADCLYSVSALGQKVEWMRDNPLVCVQIDQVWGRDDWLSIIALGRYQELTGELRLSAEAHRAEHFLRSRAMWWEPATALVSNEMRERGVDLLFYRIAIERFSGRQTQRDAGREHAFTAH